jgi:hypothetical protein
MLHLFFPQVLQQLRIAGAMLVYLIFAAAVVFQPTPCTKLTVAAKERM